MKPLSLLHSASVCGLGLLVICCLPLAVHAQPEDPFRPGLPGQTPEGRWRLATPEGDTSHRAPDDAPGAVRAAVTNAGGPDNFGYIWYAEEPFTWIDATDGADAGFTGQSRDQAIGPIPLPFPFKFYEHTYSQTLDRGARLSLLSAIYHLAGTAEHPFIQCAQRHCRPLWLGVLF